MGKAHSNALKTLPYMVYPPPLRPRLVAIAGRSESATRLAAERFRVRQGLHKLARPGRRSGSRAGRQRRTERSACRSVYRGGGGGKHVLCEKPLARSSAEAKSMLSAAGGAGVVHMTGFNYRFVPAVRQAYDLLQAGTLGEVYHFRARYLQDWLSSPTAPYSWRLSRQQAGSGALGDLGSHVVDLARFLVGEPTSVSARLRTFTEERPGGTVDVDDAFAATVEFASGATGTLEALTRRNSATATT